VNILIKATVTTMIAMVLLGGCSAQPVRDRQKDDMPEAHELLVKQSAEATRIQEALREQLERVSPPESLQAPVMPAYNPLDDVEVTVDVDNGDVQFILKALAKQANMNLLVHPTLAETPRKISVHFFNVAASTVFKQVLLVADIHGEIKDNLMIVSPMEERVFHMDIMETDISNQFSAGGDVLGNQSSGSGGSGSGGSGSGGGSSGGNSGQSSGFNSIRGEYRVDGSSAPNSNPYVALEEMLDILIGRTLSVTQNQSSIGASSVAEIGRMSTLESARRSDTALYSLNRMTGTLFVRAKPSVVSTVAGLVEQYKKVLNGQILIEAQILEVNLNDNFQWGIDWTALRNKVAVNFGQGGQSLSDISAPIPDIGQGVRTITIPGAALGTLGTASTSLSVVGRDIAATVNLLQQYGDVVVLSNPTIRGKHGQSAIISVGTSSAYIAQSSLTTNSAGFGLSTTQDVNTSTVFDGLMVGLVPFVGENGKITLTINPVQSKVLPNSLALVDAGGDIKVTLPQVELKSMMTQLTLNDGDTVILGGLIDQSDIRSREELPGLAKIPLLGHLFRNRSNASGIRELVIVLRVKLI